MFGNYGICQVLPPDPLPDCSGIQRIGAQHSDGYLTRYWVNGYGVNNDGCEGLSIQVSGQMQPDDFAYAIVDIDQFSQITPEEVDFSIDLTDVFQSLPIPYNVTVVQLHSSNALIGELILRKSTNPASTAGAGAGKTNQQTTSAEMWVVKIIWYSGSLTDVTVDSFLFGGNDVVEFNYIWDDSVISMPVSMVSLGENKTSVNPYTIDGVGFTGNANFTGEATIMYLGLISSEVLLLDGDELKFDLSRLNQDINPM